MRIRDKQHVYGDPEYKKQPPLLSQSLTTDTALVQTGVFTKPQTLSEHLESSHCSLSGVFR